MSTSEAVLEILLSGILTLIAVILLVVEAPERILADTTQGARQLSIGIAIPIAAALAYHLGWLVNMVSSRIAGATYVDRYRRLAFGPEITPTEYRIIKAKVYIQAGEAAVRVLRKHVSVQRITRGNVINFMLLGVALAYRQPAFEGLPYTNLSVACFGVAIVSGIAALSKQRRYAIDVAALAVALQLWEKEKLPREAKSKIRLSNKREGGRVK